MMNIDLLTTLTIVSDYLVMIVSVWMAMYVVGRGYPNRIAVRAIVVLLALAFYSYDAITATLSPNGISQAVQQVTIMIALVAGFHFVHSLLPEKKQSETAWVLLLATVGGSIATIIFLRTSIAGEVDRLFVTNLDLSSPNFVVGIIQVLLAIAMFYGLYLIVIGRNWPNNRSLIVSLVLGISTIAYGVVGAIFQRPLPRVVSTALLLGAITVLGFSVAKYQTLLDRRVPLRDLPITALSIFGITAVYVFAGWQSGFSVQQIALLSVLTIVTHFLFDFSRQALDRSYNTKDREYLQNIRSLARSSIGETTLKDNLRKGLAIICYNLQASGGFIAVKNSGDYEVLASYHSLPSASMLTARDVEFDEIAKPGGELSENVVWLAPAYSGSEQAAVLGIGTRTNRQDYSEEDLNWLEDVADQIGAIVSTYSGTTETSFGIQPDMGRRAKLEEDQPGFDVPLWKPAEKTDPELVKLVEDGYRNLHDYMVLGTSPLSEILNASGDTHIEIGKSVQEILTSTLSSLRPSAEEPPEPLPREWHSYTILHDAYVEDTPDRDIMGKLYISEGTFYRTRRKALRGVTRAIVETLALSV